MVKPTFISIGPARSGTSWLYQVLKSHPSISISKVKETEYFNHNYEKGSEWYESFFTKSNQSIGEISSAYFCEPDVPKRIYKYNYSITYMFIDVHSMIISFRVYPNSYVTEGSASMGSVSGLPNSENPAICVP